MGQSMSSASTSLSDWEEKPVKPLAVTVKTACKLLGVGNTTMWHLIGTGRVKTIHIGRRRLVIYSSLEALLSDDGAGS